MSSPPKEKIETKGGHLPAGNAPWAAALFFCLITQQAFVSALPSITNLTVLINAYAITAITVARNASLQAPFISDMSHPFAPFLYFLICVRSTVTSSNRTIRLYSNQRLLTEIDACSYSAVRAARCWMALTWRSQGGRGQGSSR